MSNPNPPKRKSIDEYGGIVAYLNTTADKHGGLTGDKFVEYAELGMYPSQIVKQAKDTITAAAVSSWIRRLRAERNDSKPLM